MKPQDSSIAHRRSGVRGLPWHVARDHAVTHFTAGSNPFGELHLAMIAAAHDDRPAPDAAAARPDAGVARGHGGATVVRRWIDALVALLDDDAARARAALEACVADGVRIGGSHAQREAIALTRDAARVPRAR